MKGPLPTRLRVLAPSLIAATFLLVACRSAETEGNSIAGDATETAAQTFDQTGSPVRQSSADNPSSAPTTAGAEPVSENDTVGPPTSADPTSAPTSTSTPADTDATTDTTTASSSPTTAGPASTVREPTGERAQPGDANDAYGGGGTIDCPVFPADNWWNQTITSLPVHERSTAWVASMGSRNLHPDFGTVWDGKAIGIPFVVVGADEGRVDVSFTYGTESDPGPYPIPPNAPIEDGSDRHVLVIDNDNCLLYELFDAQPVGGGASWQAGSGAVFDLRTNDLRPGGWTSADAAGLPIYPGLVTYEEVVVEGRIDHALRFTASRTQRAYLRPATHFASSDNNPDLPPMGARFRLRSSFDCGSYSTEVQVICQALKTYGMFLADNGTDWHLSGAPDPRWNDSALADLKRIPGSAFEAVDTGETLVS